MKDSKCFEDVPDILREMANECIAGEASRASNLLLVVDEFSGHSIIIAVSAYLAVPKFVDVLAHNEYSRLEKILGDVQTPKTTQ